MRLSLSYYASTSKNPPLKQKGDITKPHTRIAGGLWPCDYTI